jgi:ABC-type enterobactin transport system permease subunit
MHNAAGNSFEIEARDRNDAYGAVVSDLVALIEHVRASLTLIEQAAVQETLLGNQESCAEFIVLDDVTPRYLKAAAALSACDANLGIALHSLQESNTSQRGTRELASRQPALSIIHA